MTEKLKIVHLDDHLLFQQAVQRALDPHEIKLYIQKFQHSDDAHAFIKSQLNRGEQIDLIVTDLCHLRQNGYEFAKSVREYEANYFIRIPILLLSMHNKDLPIIQTGLDEGVFDFNLTKASEGYQIRDAIERLTNFKWA